MADLKSLNELRGMLPATQEPAQTEIGPVEIPVSEPITPTPESSMPSAPPVSPTAQMPLSELRSFLPEQQEPDIMKEGLEQVGRTAYERLMGTDVSDPRELDRLVTEIFGSLYGAELGSRVPGPPWLKAAGTIAGGVAGVAGGAAAPEAMLHTLETIGVMPPGSARKISLSREELETVIKGELLLESLSLGGAGLLRTGGRLTARLFTGMTKEGRKIAEQSARLGINLMPVQIGDRTLGRGFVAVMGRFPLVGRPFVTRGMAAEKGFGRQVKEMPSRIAPLLSQSDLGRKIYQDAEGLLKTMNDGFKKQYEEVWRQADAAGVMVDPQNTLFEVQKILNKVKAKTPTGVRGQQAKMNPIDKKLVKFLRDTFSIMEEELPDGTKIIRNQSLRQMDGLAESLDKWRISLEPGQARTVQAQLAKLKIGILKDMKTRVVGGGPEAQNIANRLKQIDENFSFVMKQYFETATAKGFGTVKRRGLRAIEFDEATRKHVDELAKFVVNLNSPDAIKELRRIISPSTFRTIKANALYDAMNSATREGAQEGHIVFDVERFERNIGFDSLTSPRGKTIQEMFKRGNVTTKDMEGFIEIGKKMSGLEIPNVSSFIARRAILAGRGGIWSAFFIGAGASAASGYEAGGFAGLAIHTVLFAGGVRLLSAILANPNTARPFMRVINKEASVAQKRAALIRVIRLGLEGSGYGIGGFEEEAQKQYRQVMGLPGPGLTEQQKQQGQQRLQSRAINDIMQFVNKYVDFGLGEKPEPEETEQREPLQEQVYHKGGLVRDHSKLAANLEKMPANKRELHLRHMYQKKRPAFDDLMNYLEK